MSRAKRWKVAGALASALVLSTLGCNPVYSELNISVIEGAGDVSDGVIEVQEGRVVLIRVTPVAAGAPGYEDYDIVDLNSDNAEIAFVEGARHVDEFIIGGVRVGDTGVSVSVNGDPEDTLVVNVVPQDGEGALP